MPAAARLLAQNVFNSRKSLTVTISSYGETVPLVLSK